MFLGEVRSMIYDYYIERKPNDRIIDREKYYILLLRRMETQ